MVPHESDMVYLTARNPDVPSEKLYAAARVQLRKGRLRAQVSTWETSEGAPVDDTGLTSRARKLATATLAEARYKLNSPRGT